jgi:hypothetical protein
MKNIFTLILALVFSKAIYSQNQPVAEKHLNDSTESEKVSFYSGVGISLGNEITNFKESAYLSIENGLMFHDFYGGIVLGNGDLRLEDKNYFYEIKAGYSFPIGILSGNTFFGYGRYFESSGFIEYGTGISYSCKKVSFGVSYSNWAGNDYITPSITYNW